MCGIVGFTGTQNAAPVLLDGLSKLEYRGYDSAGIAVVQGNQIAISKVTGRIQNLREKTDDGRLVPGTTGIGHTRWATHGAPNDINAHPHASNDGKFAVVHNGIIENYMELREELLRKGYRFESETDTEVIVHLIEMYYAGDFRKAVMKASSRLVGSYALGIVCTDAPDTVLAVREASPLILGVGIGENFFASDVTALVAHSSSEKLFEQVRQFHPQIAALSVEPKEIPADIRESCQWMFGENVLLELSQIGKVCHTKCAIYHLAGDCIFPREGVFFVALEDGEVKPGDPVQVVALGDGTCAHTPPEALEELRAAREG